MAYFRAIQKKDCRTLAPKETVKERVNKKGEVTGRTGKNPSLCFSETEEGAVAGAMSGRTFRYGIFKICETNKTPDIIVKENQDTPWMTSGDFDAIDEVRFRDKVKGEGVGFAVVPKRLAKKVAKLYDKNRFEAAVGKLTREISWAKDRKEAEEIADFHDTPDKGTLEFKDVLED